MKLFSIIVLVVLNFSVNAAFAASLITKKDEISKYKETCFYFSNYCSYKSTTKPDQRIFEVKNSSLGDEDFDASIVKTGWDLNLNKINFVLKYHWKM